MKKITSALLIAMTFSSVSHADTCRSTTLILNPARGTSAVCKSLQMTGPVQLMTCTSGQATLKTSAIEVTLTQVGKGYTSTSTFVDSEDRSVSISQLTLNLKDGNFSSHDVTTDRRGHVRSNATCAGTISY